MRLFEGMKRPVFHVIVVSVDMFSGGMRLVGEQQ